MKIKNIRCALSVLVFISTNVLAEVVQDVGPSTSQAIVERDAKGVVSCGVRLLVIEPDTHGKTVAEIALAINRDAPTGTVSVARFDGSNNSTDPAPIPTQDPPKDFWMAIDNDSVRISTVTMFKSSHSGVSIGIEDPVKISDIIGYALFGKPIQYHFAGSSDKYFVRRFKPEISSDVTEEYTACVQGLLRQISASQAGGKQ